MPVDTNVSMESYSKLASRCLFYAVEKICKILIRNSARPYFVGGCVRDALLGASVSDFDIEVFGFSIEEITAVLGEHFKLNLQKYKLNNGSSYGVLKVSGYDIDISVPRHEVRIGLKHGDFDIQYLKNCTIAEAASRRDFTINAIYFDVKNNKICDPHDGISDLNNKILHSVSDKFCEDPLRVLRGMQFSGRFELSPSSDLVNFAKTLDPFALSPERIFCEWRKFILLSVKPSCGLKFLKLCSWTKFFPEIDTLINCQQDPRRHPEGSVFEHVCLTLDLFAKNRTGVYFDDLVVGFTMLCHDFGKSITTTMDGNGIHHYGHDTAGAPLTRQFLERMRAPKKLINGVESLVLHHVSLREIYKLPHGRESAIMKLANSVGGLDQLIRVCEYDSHGRGGIWGDPASPEYSVKSVNFTENVATKFGVLKNKPAPIIRGRDLLKLGLQQSEKFGEILKKCFDAQLDLKFVDHNGGLKFLKLLFDKN